MSSTISFRQVEAFRAVMLSGSVTGAADLMGVSQPAVSRLITEFERQLGLRLFKRGRGRLSPRPEADALYAEVARSFAGLEKITQAAAWIRNKQGAQFRIAAMPALGLSFLPGVICELIRRRPHLSVSLHTYNSPGVVERVRTRNYDLGFAMTPFDGGGLLTSPLLRVNCVCILPPEHRLVGRECVSVEDLRGEPFISLAGNTMTRFSIDATFNAVNVPRRLEIEGQSSASVARFVALGAGVSIIEPFTAQLFAASGGAVCRFVPPVEFTFAYVRPLNVDEMLPIPDFLQVLDSALEPYLLKPGAPGPGSD